MLRIATRWPLLKVGKCLGRVRWISYVDVSWILKQQYPNSAINTSRPSLISYDFGSEMRAYRLAPLRAVWTETVISYKLVVTTTELRDDWQFYMNQHIRKTTKWKKTWTWSVWKCLGFHQPRFRRFVVFTYRLMSITIRPTTFKFRMMLYGIKRHFQNNCKVFSVVIFKMGVIQQNF